MSKSQFRIKTKEEFLRDYPNGIIPNWSSLMDRFFGTLLPEDYVYGELYELHDAYKHWPWTIEPFMVTHIDNKVTIEFTL